MKILAVDPGLATGVATWDDGVFDSMIWPYPEIMDYLEATVMAMDVVVYEMFIVTARTLKLSRQYEPFELIGVIKYLGRKYEVELVPQLAGDAKTFVSNSMLKNFGWYAPGPGHDNDAARHLGKYLADTQRETFTRLVKEAA